MGWTSYHAKYYKNGKVDRKAECDNMLTWESEDRKVEVVKSSMVGSVYYGAVKSIDKVTGEERVCGAIFLTSTDMKDYFNFSYKDMDETMRPYHCNCPKGILDLLTPTDNEWANGWREECYENIAKKKNPDSLNKLPVGSIIEVTIPFDTNLHNKGDKVKLTKVKNWNSNRTSWQTGYCRFNTSLMKCIEDCKDCYIIIKRGV